MRTKSQSIANGLIIFIITFAILYIGKLIFMPLTLAFTAWFLIKELVANLNKISIRGRKMSHLTQNILAFIVVVIGFALLSIMVITHTDNIIRKVPEYQANINDMLKTISINSNFNFQKIINNFIKDYDFGVIITDVLTSVSSVFSNIFLILFYLIFVLLEATSLNKKVEFIFENVEMRNKTKTIIAFIDKTMSDYVTLKTFTSFLTGLLSFGVLILVGVDFALFWAFLIFLLNYIPTIGSLIATAFPVIIALLQFCSFVQPAIVLGLVATIQLIVGNYVEPKMMGSSLNISPLVVLVTLVFWGWLWGVVGMIISVPVTIVIMIIFSQIKNLRWIAVLLSADGVLPKIKKEDEVPEIVK